MDSVSLSDLNFAVQVDKVVKIALSWLINLPAGIFGRSQIFARLQLYLSWDT